MALLAPRRPVTMDDRVIEAYPDFAPMDNLKNTEYTAFFNDTYATYLVNGDREISTVNIPQYALIHKAEGKYTPVGDDSSSYANGLNKLVLDFTRSDPGSRERQALFEGVVNRWLSKLPDEREYRGAAVALMDIGIEDVELLSRCLRKFAAYRQDILMLWLLDRAHRDATYQFYSPKELDRDTFTFRGPPPGASGARPFHLMDGTVTVLQSPTIHRLTPATAGQKLRFVRCIDLVYNAPSRRESDPYSTHGIRDIEKEAWYTNGGTTPTGSPLPLTADFLADEHIGADRKVASLVAASSRDVAKKSYQVFERQMRHIEDNGKLKVIGRKYLSANGSAFEDSVIFDNRNGVGVMLACLESELYDVQTPPVVIPEGMAHPGADRDKAGAVGDWWSNNVNVGAARHSARVVRLMVPIDRMDEFDEIFVGSTESATVSNRANMVNWETLLPDQVRLHRPHGYACETEECSAYAVRAANIASALMDVAVSVVPDGVVYKSKAANAYGGIVETEVDMTDVRQRGAQLGRNAREMRDIKERTERVKASIRVFRVRRQEARAARWWAQLVFWSALAGSVLFLGAVTALHVTGRVYWARLVTLLVSSCVVLGALVAYAVGYRRGV